MSVAATAATGAATDPCVSEAHFSWLSKERCVFSVADAVAVSSFRQAALRPRQGLAASLHEKSAHSSGGSSTGKVHVRLALTVVTLLVN